MHKKNKIKLKETSFDFSDNKYIFKFESTDDIRSIEIIQIGIIYKNKWLCN